MALQRKKVTVRTKRGKVYQRSMMVQAQAIGRRASKSGKLHALNPWEQRHTEHVNTNSALGERAKMYGSSGPGSNNSWFAHVVGSWKQHNKAYFEANTMGPMRGEHYAATTQHSGDRIWAGKMAATDALSRMPTPGRRVSGYADAILGPPSSGDSHRMLMERHGRDNVHQVHQDPRKWVR